MPSIKEHCCGADMLFNAKKAKKEYRKYLRKGPGKASRKLIGQLAQMSLDGKSMLDIGGGIGALQWWFLESGGAHTTDVDASSGYLALANEHANQQGWADKATFKMGDIVDVEGDLQAADVVTLDKVVCCYPNYEEIIEVSCNKSKEIVALTYPMDGFVASTLRNLGSFFIKLTGNPYRPYVHSVTKIRDQFKRWQFECVASEFSFPWYVETYRRTA